MRHALAILNLALLASCAQTVTHTQTFPDNAKVSIVGDEVNTSWRNSDPVISYEAQPGTLGITPTVQVGVGTSMSDVAGVAAQAAGSLPIPLGAQPMKSIFINEDELSASMVKALVNALDGKVIVVYSPALRDPITVTLHLK